MKYFEISFWKIIINRKLINEEKLMKQENETI